MWRSERWFVAFLLCMFGAIGGVATWRINRDMESLGRDAESGYVAGRAGIPHTACPYTRDAERSYWLNGWVRGVADRQAAGEK